MANENDPSWQEQRDEARRERQYVERVSREQNSTQQNSSNQGCAGVFLILVLFAGGIAYEILSLMIA